MICSCVVDGLPAIRTEPALGEKCPYCRQWGKLSEKLTPVGSQSPLTDSHARGDISRQPQTPRDLAQALIQPGFGVPGRSVPINVSFQPELPAREEPVLHRFVPAGSFDWIV
jgi:hypothetical protein